MVVGYQRLVRWLVTRNDCSCLPSTQAQVCSNLVLNNAVMQSVKPEYSILFLLYNF